MNTPRITQPRMIQLRVLGLLMIRRDATKIRCSTSEVHKSPSIDYRQYIVKFSLHQDRICILIGAQSCVLLNVFF